MRSLIVALVALLAPLLVSGLPPHRPTDTLSRFHPAHPSPNHDGFISDPSPPIPHSIDCALKAFAAQYAGYLQPLAWPHSANWSTQVVAAMALPTLCNTVERDIPPPPMRRQSTIPARAVATPACDWVRYVDGLKGSQANNGSLAHPWADVTYALAQSRTRRTTLTRACIYVRGGPGHPPHWFGDHHEHMGRAFESQLGAIALTAADSNLTIAAYQGEEVVFSGGVPLDLQWSVHEKMAAGTVMKARIPDSVAVDWDNFNELYIDEWRAVRAKFPNGDPFLTSRLTQPTGYVDGAASWVGPDASIPPAVEIHVSDPLPRSTYFTQYQLGLEGTVNQFDPPHSFWALSNPPGGGGSTYVRPEGFVWNERFSPRVANWTNVEAGKLFSFHGEGWGSWQYEIASVNPESKTIMLGRGGFQEARGSPGGGLMYVHNIREELDDANEFYVDSSTRTIYYMSNGTMPKQFIASQVPCIISMQGSRQAPVEAVTVSGIRFVHTPNHFLRSYEAPSGGDYSVHRGGAVVLQGTANVVVAGNTFEHLGGNAIVVSNFNDNATIIHNQFQWLGESAIILVGRSDTVDGVSNRDQPTRTHIESNVAHDICVYVKQGDFVFESLSRSSVWAGNLAYNAPRSLFNKNDGFAGGLDVYQNLLFNANKETTDHGPYNTWDREPYITEEGGMGASLVPKWNRNHNNFFINDYGSHILSTNTHYNTPASSSTLHSSSFVLIYYFDRSNMAIDHDDGSAYYVDSYNMFMYSGTKNYLGHSKVNDHQLFAYSDVVWGYGYPACEDEFTNDNFDSAWINSRCILFNQTSPYAINYCDVKNVTNIPLHANNSIYTPTGNATLKCGDVSMTLAQWQAMGMDPGTTQGKTPDVKQVIQWASEILYLKSGYGVEADAEIDRRAASRIASD